MADKEIFNNSGPTKPDVPKSFFDLSHVNNLTARFGRAIPNFLYDAPAGSSFEIDPYFGFDLDPMVFPIQSNVRLHQKFYKIPKRILWDNFEDFIGQHGNHVIPYIKRSYFWHDTGSLADYMGIPSVRFAEVEEEVAVTTSLYEGYGPATTYSSSGHEIEFRPNTFRSYCIHGRITDPMANNQFILTYISPEVINASAFANSHFKVVLRGANSLTTTSLMVVDVPYSTGSSVTPRWNFSSNSRNLPFILSGRTMYKSRIFLTLGDDFREYVAAYLASHDWLDVYFVWDNSEFGNPSNQHGVTGVHTISHTTYVHNPDTPDKVDSSLIDVNYPSGLEYVFEYVALRGQPVDISSNSPFMAINGADPKLPICALPFRAYEFIHQYFFNNERITPFTINGVETFNKFITNRGDGADESTPLEFFNVPWEYDMFTTCVKTPQFGNAPLVGITYNDSSTVGVLHMLPQDGSAPYNIGVQTDENGTVMAISNYDDIADRPGVQRLSEAIDYGISINDFRNVNALQRFQERHLKAGTKYQNIVYEFYGTNPPVGQDFPEYLGGATDDLIVNTVVNQSKTDTAQLGEHAGTGSFRGRGHTIRCFCSEECYIMGIIYFSVTPSYSQMLPRLFTKTHLLEFQNPQFNFVSPQPVYTHQLAPLQLDDDHLFDTFGYNRPFVDYVTMQDEVHGDFRTNMHNYLVQRIFGSQPKLNGDFLYVKPEDVTDVFSVQENTDKIHGQVYFKVSAKLPLPRFTVPRII